MLPKKLGEKLLVKAGKTSEQPVGDYLLEFGLDGKDLGIKRWARNVSGTWQWFKAPFPHESKLENTPAWKKAWDKAFKDLGVRG